MSNVGKRGKLSLETRLRDADLNGTNTRLQHHEIKRVREALASARKAPAEGAGEQSGGQIAFDAWNGRDGDPYWFLESDAWRQRWERVAIALRARSSAPEAREGEAVAWERCTRCDRGEVFGMSDDSGFWVEFSSVAGGGNEHGMNGWLELVEHWPDGRDVRREYVAKDSPLYAAQSADKPLEVLRDLMDTEFAKDWRTWSKDRATRLLGIGPRLDAFLAAREAALKAEGGE